MVYRVYTPSFSNGINKDSIRDERVVVSLTSYGRRVREVLPFALYSLYNQTYKADEIVLWLDENNWSDDKLPKRIKKLKDKGLLTVKYWSDIRSYKKLVPSLITYPNDILITVDDDLYYRRDLLERLVMAHKEYPGYVITHRANRVGYNTDSVIPYNDWEDLISDACDNNVFPTGGAGCLYKKEMLYADVTRDDIFMKLSPLADDVWFFFMEILKGTPRMVLKKKGYVFIPVDGFYQYFHDNSSLNSQNNHEDQNDVQIKAIMNYYNLKVKNNCIIKD